MDNTLSTLNGNVSYPPSVSRDTNDSLPITQGKTSMQSSTSEVETTASIVSRPWVSKKVTGAQDSIASTPRVNGSVIEEPSEQDVAVPQTCIGEQARRQRSSLEQLMVGWPKRIKARFDQWYQRRRSIPS